MRWSFWTYSRSYLFGLSYEANFAFTTVYGFFKVEFSILPSCRGSSSIIQPLYLDDLSAVSTIAVVHLSFICSLTYLKNSCFREFSLKNTDTNVIVWQASCLGLAENLLDMKCWITLTDLDAWPYGSEDGVPSVWLSRWRISTLAVWFALALL